MAPTPHYCTGSVTVTSGFFTFGDSGMVTLNATEAQHAIRYRQAGIFSNLTVYWLSGTAGGTCTFRTGGVNGNEIVSPTATGFTIDSNHTDAIAASALVDLDYAGGGNSPVVLALALLFNATSGTVKKFQLGNATLAYTTASTTTYLPLCGYMLTSAAAAESQVQAKLFINATLQNLYVYISANTSTNACTLGTRINSGNGNQSVSVPGSSGAGLFEDLTDTDSIVATGTVVDYYLTSGSGTVAISVSAMADECTTLDSTTSVINAGGAAAVTQASLPAGIGFGGIIAASSSLTYPISLAMTPSTVSQLTINISANTIAATSTLSLYKNNNPANSAASITSSGTGYFTDITHTDTQVSTDQLGYVLSTAGASGSITPRTITAKLQMPITSLSNSVFAFNDEYHWMGGDDI